MYTVGLLLMLEALGPLITMWSDLVSLGDKLVIAADTQGYTSQSQLPDLEACREQSHSGPQA